MSQPTRSPLSCVGHLTSPPFFVRRISVHDLAPAALTCQLLSILPVKDKIGRTIMFIQPKNVNFEKFSKEDLIRLAWYTLEQATEDEVTQKFGLLTLNDPSGASIANFDRGFLSLVAVGPSLPSLPFFLF